MCSDECKSVFKKNIETIVQVFKENLQQDSDKIISCFYSCLQQEFVKRASILYSSYSEDFMTFISTNSFTDSIITFTKKAAAGNIYDGNVSLKSVLMGFYMTTVRQHLQTEMRLSEKKEKYTRVYKDETTVMDIDGMDLSEERYLLLEQALQKMEPDDRQIIIWRHLEEKKCDEIAGILGITTESATNRIYRCMERLRKLSKNSN